jgi:anthranilate phosphoribosyltransferase
MAATLRKIVYHEPLTADEARRALNRIGAEDVITDADHSDGMYLLALMFGLMAKGLTTEELFGLAQSIADNSARFPLDLDPAQIIDLSGTGGDVIKTFNVGTAASFVVASTGAYVAKQASRGYTGPTGSADVFTEVGADVFANAEVDQVVNTLKASHVAAFYTPAFSPQFRTRVDFLTKLRSIGLTFPSPWHLVSWVYSPVPMSSRLYGVFSAQYVPSIAELFARFGYSRVMVVHGVDGLDEVSTIGPTVVAEVTRGRIEHYTITPDVFGVTLASREDIETQSGEESVRDFFRVLYGQERGPKRDLVAVNAGTALYLLGQAQTLREGTERAIAQLANRASAQVLEQYVALAGNPGKLLEWKRRLGI